MSIEVTELNFKDEVDTTGPVLVDFWAAWCGPCRMLAPTLEQIEEETGLKIVKVNIDEESELARAFQIMSIPTMILFDDGAPVKTIVGVKPKKTLVEEINQYVAL